MTRRLLLLVIGNMLLLGTPAAGAPTWGAPIQLSSGDRALGPELAVSPAGDAAAVWDQEVGPDCANSPASLTCAHIVELTTRKRGTSAWQSPVELARPGIGDRPRVAIDDAGDAVVAWVHDVGRDRVLQAAFRSRAVSAWPEANDISEPSLGVPDFRIGLGGDGDAVAAWVERTATGTALRVATRSVASGGWGAARTLSRPGGNVAGGPSLALTQGGVVVVVWIEGGAVWEIDGLIRSGYWANPSQVSSGESGVAFGTPDVAFDQVTGDIVAVWASRTASGDCCGVQTAFYSNSLRVWEQHAVAGDLRLPFDSPQVGAGNRNAIAVWVSGFGIESAARAQATRVWSGPTLVSARSSTMADPDVALDSRGNAVVVWMNGKNDVVQAAIRPGASGKWQRSVDVSESGSSNPRVSMDATGDAVGVWNRRSEQRVVVESSDLTGGGPVLAGLTVPKRAVTRARVRFSVRPTPWASPLAGDPIWRFGDGKSATGTRVAHAYARTGRYSVSVSQADAAGGVSTSMATVTVIGTRVRNRRPPSIRGMPRVGNTLTCSRGLWTGSPPIHYSFGWRRDGRLIPGATQRRYALRRPDAGSLIACEVRAANPAGSARATSGAVAVKG
jgi:hypothetical protein